MKVSNGKDNFELERNKTIFQVRLKSTQFNEMAVKELPEHVNVNEEEDAWLLSYSISETAKSLATAIQESKSTLERLKLAQQLAAISHLSEQIRIPFIHPENIFLEGGTIFVVHFGLKGLVVPMEITESDFISSYKALVLNIFNPKNSFEHFVATASPKNDKFSQTINGFENISELISFINEELRKETEKANRKFALVSKGRYQFFKYFGILSIITAVVLAWFTYSYFTNNQKQSAIITAQTSFLTSNYAQTQTDLASYSPSELPKSARYILAVSSVNLSDLTMAQKDAILNTISTKSDDNTLNYWVYSGRGNFNEALDLAQNLGDNQLTLLAYMNLYETTKLNSTMKGEEKQALLDEYKEKIEELTGSLEE